jgi:Flp pilus assembly protein TadD
MKKLNFKKTIALTSLMLASFSLQANAEDVEYPELPGFTSNKEVFNESNQPSEKSNEISPEKKKIINDVVSKVFSESEEVGNNKEEVKFDDINITIEKESDKSDQQNEEEKTEIAIEIEEEKDINQQDLSIEIEEEPKEEKVELELTLEENDEHSEQEEIAEKEEITNTEKQEDKKELEFSDNNKETKESEGALAISKKEEKADKTESKKVKKKTIKYVYKELDGVYFKPEYMKPKMALTLSDKKSKVISINSEDFPESKKINNFQKDLQRNIYRNDLDFLTFDSDEEYYTAQNLPTKNPKLEIKNNIDINRGFGENQAFEDRSKNESPDLSLIEQSPEDLAKAQIAEKLENTDESNKPFYLREQDIQVQVQNRPYKNNVLEYFKNASDALAVGQYESSIAYYKEILKNNKNDKRALFGIATAYHISGQFQLAKLAYEKLIRIDNENWKAVNNYVILLSEENPEIAEQKLLELWRKNPRFATLPAKLANLELKKGNLGKAANYYAEAVKIERKNPKFLFNLGLIHEKMGNKKVAASLYGKLLRMSSQGVELTIDPIKLEKRYFKLMSGR